jgi:4-aminobutyrate aminotransferase-like enzyme
MERENLPQKAAVMGEKLKSELQQLARKFPQIVDVRGKGLMIGVEFGTKRDTQTFVRNCLEMGLIVGGTLHTEKVVRIAPPLIISDEEVDWAISVMAEVMRTLTD